jgi:DNA-binding response OmpR family regulator
MQHGEYDVTMSFSAMELMRSGQPISLTYHEFMILKFMVQNPERLLSREELLREVWGYQNYPHTRTLDTHMFKRSSCGKNWSQTLRIPCISKPSTASVTSSCAKTAIDSLASGGFFQR